MEAALSDAHDHELLVVDERRDFTVADLREVVRLAQIGWLAKLAEEREEAARRKRAKR